LKSGKIGETPEHYSASIVIRVITPDDLPRLSAALTRSISAGNLSTDFWYQTEPHAPFADALDRNALEVI
jgi:hypothetical protein